MRARDKWAVRVNSGEKKMIDELRTQIDALKGLFAMYTEYLGQRNASLAAETKFVATSMLETIEAESAFLRGTGPEHRKMRSYIFRFKYFFNPLDITPLNQALREIEAILSEDPDQATRDWAEANIARLARLKKVRPKGGAHTT